MITLFFKSEEKTINIGINILPIVKTFRKQLIK